MIWLANRRREQSGFKAKLDCASQGHSRRFQAAKYQSSNKPTSKKLSRMRRWRSKRRMAASERLAVKHQARLLSLSINISIKRQAEAAKRHSMFSNTFHQQHKASHPFLMAGAHVVSLCRSPSSSYSSSLFLLNVYQSPAFLQRWP